MNTQSVGHKGRCSWCGDDPQYVAYHDEEWGRPQKNPQALFEKLCLEGFQAGLSWITILRKRDHFRQVFDGFDPQKMAQYDDEKCAQLMQDKGIIRNRLKIQSSVTNAKAFLEIEAQEGFAHFLWSFVDHTPIQNKVISLKDIPSKTPQSDAMSKALKKRGFKFVGPTITYAFMQSVGMVNDHFTSCKSNKICADLAKDFHV